MRSLSCSARRICGSSSTTRTRAPLTPAPAPELDRRAARARTSRRGPAPTRPRAGRRSARRSRARSRARGPSRGRRRRPRANGSKIDSRSAAATPGPSVGDRDTTSPSSPRRRPRPVGRRRVSEARSRRRLTSTRSICAASTRTGGGSRAARRRSRVAVGRSRPARGRRARRPARARACGVAAPASSRERSSRFPTSRSRRRAWTRIDASSSCAVALGETSAPRALARGPDRRDRRAQVVADRAQHGRRLVAASASARSASLVRRRARRQRADAHGRDEVDGERDPVLRVAQLEGVPRRQEEPVERQHADDRDRHRVTEAAERGDRQHREEVEHAETEDRRDRAQRVDAPVTSATAPRLPPSRAAGGCACSQHRLARRVLRTSQDRACASRLRAVCVPRR